VRGVEGGDRVLLGAAPNSSHLIDGVIQNLGAREPARSEDSERLVEVVFMPLDRVTDGRGDRSGGQLLDLVPKGLLEIFGGLDPHGHVDALLRAETRRPEQVVIGEGLFRLCRRRAVDRHPFGDSLDAAGPQERQGQHAHCLEVPTEGRLGELVLKESAGRLLAVVRLGGNLRHDVGERRDVGLEHRLAVFVPK
jgi:hypothetical protein